MSTREEEKEKFHPSILRSRDFHCIISPQKCAGDKIFTASPGLNLSPRFRGCRRFHGPYVCVRETVTQQRHIGQHVATTTRYGCVIEKRPTTGGIKAKNHETEHVISHFLPINLVLGAFSFFDAL